jgi:3-deoxy-manno-octulosonate cytidylyltransferase (CMP-KDO synthetase)
MKIISIIPARMASSRFPGKPMALIHGIPMIGHCYHRIRMCEALQEIYVATCDREISEYIESIGGRAIMTAKTHERASDRVAEALKIIEEQDDEKVDIVVMVQGDEPMDTPSMVNEAVTPFYEDETVKVVNLMGEIETLDEFNDPNTVKVVVDPNDNAIYFSREAIPSRKKSSETFPMLKQICVIPFRREYLLEYCSLRQTPLEKIESVDMLRVIESGSKVRMVMTKDPSIGVDTKQDLENVTNKMLRDPLMSLYS